MYQQNPYQQQQQSHQLQAQLKDEDFANFVLSELKRSAREYTTAALEAANPQIRQTFQSLLQKTLQDQAAVFQEIQKLGQYEIQAAPQQQIGQELQKQSQIAAQLQSFVQQNLSQTSTASYQQQDQTTIAQQQQQHQQQSQQQNQIAALYQTQTPIQPMISASQYPNAVYNNQGQGYSTHTQSSPNQTSQQQAYISNLQGQNYQDQNYGQTGYGHSQGQGYAASTGYSASENAGMTSKPASSTNASRSQTSSQSSTAGESSYLNKQHEGSKYSF